MNVEPGTSLDEAYAMLRRTGEVYVSADRAPSVVAGLRRRAHADGLSISAYRGSGRRMSRSQARNRSTTISLTNPGGADIVRPDAERTTP